MAKTNEVLNWVSIGISLFLSVLAVLACVLISIALFIRWRKRRSGISRLIEETTEDFEEEEGTVSNEHELHHHHYDGIIHSVDSDQNSVYYAGLATSRPQSASIIEDEDEYFEREEIGVIVEMVVNQKMNEIRSMYASDSISNDEQHHQNNSSHQRSDSLGNENRLSDKLRNLEREIEDKLNLHLNELKLYDQLLLQQNEILQNQQNNHEVAADERSLEQVTHLKEHAKRLKSELDMMRELHCNTVLQLKKIVTRAKDRSSNDLSELGTPRDIQIQQLQFSLDEQSKVFNDRLMRQSNELSQLLDNVETIQQIVEPKKVNSMLGSIRNITRKDSLGTMPNGSPTRPVPLHVRTSSGGNIAVRRGSDAGAKPFTRIIVATKENYQLSDSRSDSDDDTPDTPIIPSFQQQSI